MSGVLVAKTQILFLQHIPISLVFAYGIDGQDFSILPEKQAGFVIHLELIFYLCFKSIPDVILNKSYSSPRV
ncbi:hypothetical protein LC605_12205 [Nostoc sp. CHAB 5836]|nr:hypothetical protein [Nostoc sp. CHAB 5836]